MRWTRRLIPLVPVALAAAGLAASRWPQGTRELSPREQALHVLHRLAHGPRPGDVERVLTRGVDRWIEDQLRPGRDGDATLAPVLAVYRHLDKSAADLRREFPPPGAIRRDSRGARGAVDSVALRTQLQAARTFMTELHSARVARAVASERQLDEVMTDFWLNHFNVYAAKNARMRYTLPDFERETIRPHALGRYRDLLGAVAHSPAMLIYLDNALSVADSTRPTLVDRARAERRVAFARRAMVRRGTADSARLDQLLARRPRGLNENYARELLELHTLGVDGGYTQQDVIDVARALTGWTVRPGTEDGFFFNRAAHDAGEKTILGQRFPAGRGEDEGERVLDLLARHPSTARHIARKLCVRFVSDAPPEGLVERAAATFTRTDGDLRAVVRSIVTSDEFFSRAAWRAKVKSPFEVVVSAIRALGGRPDSTALSAAVVAQLGQPLYGHQAPDGWPETGDEWLNTGAILARINFGMLAASDRIPGTRLKAWERYAALAAAPRAAQVEGVVETLLGGVATPETRAILESGQHPMLASATSAASPEDAETRGMRGAAVMRGDRMGARLPAPRTLSGLDQLVGLALGAPEFQRR